MTDTVVAAIVSIAAAVLSLQLVIITTELVRIRHAISKLGAEAGSDDEP